MIIFNELRLTNATPAPTKTPIAPQSTIIKARRGLSRFTGSSGVRKKTVSLEVIL